MAKFVTIENGCDWPDCGMRVPEGDDTIADKTLSEDGRTARVFLLCTKHREALADVIDPLLRAGIAVATKGNGRSTKKTTAAPAPNPASAGEPSPEADGKTYECLAQTDGVACGRPIRKRTGMAQHVHRTHGYANLAAYEAEFGELVPIAPPASP